MKVKTMSKFTFIESGLRMRFSYNFNTFNPSNTTPFAHPNAVTYLIELVLAPVVRKATNKFSDGRRNGGSQVVLRKSDHNISDREGIKL